MSVGVHLQDNSFRKDSRADDEPNAATENPEIEKKVIPAIVQNVPPELALQRLVEAIQPFAGNYFAADERKHQKKLGYSEKLLIAEQAHDRFLVVVGSTVLVIIFILPGALFYCGREAAANTLISLIVNTGGASFGGYGIAMRRKQQESERE